MILALFAWWLYEVGRAGARRCCAAWWRRFSSRITVYADHVSVDPGAVSERTDRERGARHRLHAIRTSPSTYAYQEPSLVFLLGTDTRFTDGAGAAEFLRGGACHFALIDPRNERSFVQRANALGLRYTLMQRIDGYNISIGKPVVMALFRVGRVP